MSEEEKKLKVLIKDKAKILACETHPQVCSLRDSNYPKLEELVISQLFQDREPVSVQTALAQIEQELGDAIVNNEIE